MLWFMKKLRKTPILGKVRRVLPLASRVHGFINCAPLAQAMALRADAEVLSNDPRISVRDFSSGLGGEFATSNESTPTMASAKPPMVAKCVASLPKLMDFSCGFHPSLS